VECVADAVTAQIHSGPKKWEVTVFDKNEANAFALPGGKIGVYTGILKYAKDQDELATVLAHEVGHVLAKHANERVSTAFATQTGLQVIEALAGSAGSDRQNAMALLGLGAQVGVILPFSRTQETEADLLGLDLMSKAGFDPRASVQLWKHMSAAGGGGPEILSTHPANQSRIDALQDRMPEALALYRKARDKGLAPHCTP
jgi:predicted Zn-dependent protease